MQGVFPLALNAMTFKRLIISVSAVLLATLALYLLIASQLLLEPLQIESLPESRPDTVQTAEIEAEAPLKNTAGLPPTVQTIPQKQTRQGGSRLIEIFGRVVDRDAQPIEDVLVTEERYFISTRSDAEGDYKILLDLPRHRYPELNFLRSGYQGKRVKLTKKHLQQQPIYELDVALEGNSDSVRLPGWVGNDIGVALEGARVDLTALDSGNGGNFYLTVLSDANGNFILEGVPARARYRLSVNLTPEYPVYRDPDFFVGPNPERINIELKSLQFVDVDGMMLNRESAPVANFKIIITNVTTGTHTRTIVSDSSGFFSLKDFPLGEISLSTRGSDFYNITGLVLTDAEYRNLILRIDKGNHYLTGWIADENGIVPEKAMVTLDRTFQEGPVEYHQYSSQATDNDGKFSFKNLGNGEYRVSVYALGYQTQQLVHRFSQQSDEIRITLRHTGN